MKFEELTKYQGDILDVLTNAFNQHRLVHAYIFDGPRGTGTEEMAIYMAMMIMCQNEKKPCLRCSSCQRIIAHSHLNVLEVKPSGEMIKKEQVDELIKEFNMTPLEGDSKVAIIYECERLNSSSSNTLLKYLEEPVDNYYLFLLTTDVNKVIDTIQSRCQLIRFKPLASKFVIHTLVDQGINLDLAYILSNVTSSFDEIKQLLEEGLIDKLLTFAKKIINSFLIDKDMFVTYYKERDTLLTLPEKKYHRLFLDIFCLIYQEILKKANRQSLGYFEDILKIIKPQDVNIELLIKKLDIVNMYQERLNYFVNLDLFYTSLLLELNQK